MINFKLISRAVLKKLRFEIIVKKIVTSNISEIYGSIILPKEVDREIQFESSKRTIKNINKIRHIEKRRVKRSPVKTFY